MHIKEVKNMFWGVTLDGGKRYTQTVERSFHLSMAALEPAKEKGADTIVSLMIQHEKAEFMLCTLQQGKLHQQPLDLNFTEGEEVTFFLSNNKGVVHLTGFLVEDDQYPDDFDPSLMEPSSDDEDDSDEDEVPALIGDEDDSEDDDDDDDDEGQMVSAGKKRKKQKKKEAIKKKKIKMEAGEDDEDDDDDFAEFFGDESMEDSDEDEEEEDSVMTKLKKKQKSGNNKKKAETPKMKQESPKVKEEQQTPKQTEDSQGEGKKKKKKKKNKNKEGNEQTDSSNTPKPQQQPKKQVLAGGVVSEDTKVGHGPVAQSGKMVHVYYTGKLQKTGQQFDSCTSGKPFRFRLGKGEVIKGWDSGVSGMKVGGKRKLTIPSQQAYGNTRQGSIPAGSTLVFEVELKSVS